MNSAFRRPRPILIDGQNVALYHHSDMDPALCLLAVNFFRRKGHETFIIFPRKSNNVHRCNDAEQRLLQKYTVHTPARWVDGVSYVSNDDMFLLRHATDIGGCIVSNDQFRTEYQEHPEYRGVIRNRTLQYTIIGSSFCVAEDPFGRGGGADLYDVLHFPPGQAPPTRDDVIRELLSDSPSSGSGDTLTLTRRKLFGFGQRQNPSHEIQSRPSGSGTLDFNLDGATPSPTNVRPSARVPRTELGQDRTSGSRNRPASSGSPHFDLMDLNHVDQHTLDLQLALMLDLESQPNLGAPVTSFDTSAACRSLFQLDRSPRRDSSRKRDRSWPNLPSVSHFGSPSRFEPIAPLTVPQDSGDPLNTQLANHSPPSLTGDPNVGKVSGISPKDPVKEIQRQVPTMSESRCKQAFRKKGNVIDAVKSLKVEKLVDMAIATKGEAFSALDSTKWDMNAAVSLLLDRV